MESNFSDLRRKLLKGSASASLLIPLLGAGLLLPTRLLAAEWQRKAFAAHSVGDALKAINSSTPNESRDITISAQEIAENGAKVDIEVSCNFANGRSLAIFADKNPTPLCAILEFSGNALPYAKLQLKLAETTRIRAIVKTTDGKSHFAFRDVKVTLGGCGG